MKRTTRFIGRDVHADTIAELGAGDLTTVWVSDRAHEALRDLVRAREAAKKDQLRARNRLSKFLLRAGRRRPQPQTRWGTRHLAWIRGQKFEHTAQQVTMDDYLDEVDHAGERVRRLEQAIDDAKARASDDASYRRWTSSAAWNREGGVV